MPVEWCYPPEAERRQFRGKSINYCSAVIEHGFQTVPPAGDRVLKCTNPRGTFYIKLHQRTCTLNLADGSHETQSSLKIIIRCLSLNPVKTPVYFSSGKQSLVRWGSQS